MGMITLSVLDQITKIKIAFWKLKYAVFDCDNYFFCFRLDVSFLNNFG